MSDWSDWTECSPYCRPSLGSLCKSSEAAACRIAAAPFKSLQPLVVRTVALCFEAAVVFPEMTDGYVSSMGVGMKRRLDI